MDTPEKIDFNSLSTYDLAFRLASGMYNEEEKLEALRVILSRDPKPKSTAYLGNSKATTSEDVVRRHYLKPPAKDSKAEKIYNLAIEGKTPQECFEILNKAGVKVYYGEIYRVYNRYGKI